MAPRNPSSAEVARGIAAELHRGLAVAAVLARLSTARYGYTLLKELASLGLAIDQNTLYPLLRRLESQGLLGSTWKIEERRPRRYYVRTKLGTAVLRGLAEELRAQRKVLEVISDEAERRDQ